MCVQESALPEGIERAIGSYFGEVDEEPVNRMLGAILAAEGEEGTGEWLPFVPRGGRRFSQKSPTMEDQKRAHFSLPVPGEAGTPRIIVTQRRNVFDTPLSRCVHKRWSCSVTVRYDCRTVVMVCAQSIELFCNGEVLLSHRCHGVCIRHEIVSKAVECQKK